MDVHLAFRKGKARGQRPCGGPLGGPSAVSGIHGHLCLKTANGKRSEIIAVCRSEGRDGIPQRPARCLCPAPLRPASDSVQSVTVAIAWAVACLRACVQVAPASFGNGHQVREQRRRGSVRPRETGRRLLEARAKGRAPPLRGFRRPLRILGCAPRGCRI